MLSALSTADWVATASALFAAIAAGASWAAVSQTRRERRDEEFRRVDGWLLDVHRAVSSFINMKLQSIGVKRFDEQWSLRTLVQVSLLPLPKCTELATVDLLAVEEGKLGQLVPEAIAEVEAARAKWWTDHGKGTPSLIDAGARR